VWTAAFGLPVLPVVNFQIAMSSRIVGVGSNGEPASSASSQASAPADSDDVKLRVVPCDGPEAAYKVVGVVNNKLQSEADADGVCGQYPDADVVYWEGYAGRPGLVLCLQDLKKSK